MNKSEEKKRLRKSILAKRSTLTSAEKREKAEQAAHFLLGIPQLAEKKRILAFYPYGDEIDTRPFIELAMQRGQEIWLPLTLIEERKLIPYIYQGEADLRQGAYGIYEPDPQKCVQADVSQLDAVVMPGIAFDHKGGRLGYGGGYYDRFLPTLRRKPLLVGLCFALQVVREVPREPHDQMLDYLVTEDGMYGRIETFPS